MNLIWHIALKDLRRLRGLLVLWAALIAAKLSIGVMLVFGIGQQFDPFRFANYWISGLEVVAGYLLVAAILHGDVLVGSNSFWMTRPVSGSRLFAAKLVALLVVFGAIPLALTLPWWLWCGYGAKEVGLAALETVGLQGLVVALALPAASLTDGMSRYLFWTLIAATALIFLASSLARIPGGSLWAASLIVAISGVVGASFHLFKRRLLAGATVLSAAGSSAVALVAVLVFGAYSQDQISARTEQASPQIQSSQFSFFGAGLLNRNRDQRSLLWIRATVEALPPETILEGTAVHRWSWPDGLVLERRASFESMGAGTNWPTLGLPPPQQDIYLIQRERANARRRRSGQPELPGIPVNAVIDSQPFVPAAFESRVLRDPPAYSLRAEIALMRPVVMGECPAEMGKTIKSAGEGTRVIVRTISNESARSYRRGDARVSSDTSSAVDPATGPPVTVYHRLYLALAEYRSTVLGRGDPYNGIGPFLFPGWPRRTYSVVNRARGNAVQDDSFYSHDTFRTDAVRIGTVGIVWRMMQVYPYKEYSVADDRFIDQPNWFEGVTLAKLQLREEERFTKELRVERFQLGSRTSTGGTP